ncbi:unnamed protein product [Musa hybrid cultivar]
MCVYIREACGASGALYALILYVTGFHSLRGQYGLREELCADCLVHCCFCELCSLCQMYRELKRRGFDMNIGWTANMERQGQIATLPPPVQDESLIYI